MGVNGPGMKRMFILQIAVAKQQGRKGQDMMCTIYSRLDWAAKMKLTILPPLKADVHSRHQGVHRAGGPYDRMDKMLGDN